MNLFCEESERSRLLSVLPVQDLEELGARLFTTRFILSAKDLNSLQIGASQKEDILVYRNDSVSELTHAYNSQPFSSMYSEHDLAKLNPTKKGSRHHSLDQYLLKLATSHNVEELLLALRDQLELGKGIKQMTLFVENQFRNNEIYFFQGENLRKKGWGSRPQSSRRVSLDNQEDQQFLASALGRPISKLMAFPLEPVHNAWLYFEYDSLRSDSDEMIRFVSELLQPFAIAFDRVLMSLEFLATSRLWEKTFDALNDPVAIIDIDLNLLRANRAFTRASPTKKCHAVFNAVPEPCSGCPLPQVFSRGDSTNGNIVVTKTPYRVHSYPIQYIRDSLPTTVVNHYVDTTRSGELYSRFVQSEKMAAIGHLAGNIAHELNNPLTGIRALAQLMISDLPPDGTLAKDLSEVELAAQRCQRIIKNLRDFGTHQTQQEAVDLNLVVERTLPLLKTALSHFQVEKNLSDGPLFVKAEPQLLQQVIFNIITNACQAMGEKGRLLIESSERDQNWTLAISDSGPGIPKHLQGQIFEPFFTTKKGELGTGLGLSMSRNIVEKFGGKIDLQSVEGRGTTFSIHLPKVSP